MKTVQQLSLFFIGVAESGFNEARETYQQTHGGASRGSLDSEGGEEMCEGGGRKGEKIDEWQAAWNVTNAIQVTFHIIFCSFNFETCEWKKFLAY